MTSRRAFLGTLAGLGGALALPLTMVAATDAVEPVKDELDSWVTLMQVCTVNGFEVTEALMAELAEDFKKPVALTIDFGPKPVGWVTTLKKDGARLLAKIEVPSFNTPLLQEYTHIVPGFIGQTHRSAFYGGSQPARLVAAALTNEPAVPEMSRMAHRRPTTW